MSTLNRRLQTMKAIVHASAELSANAAMCSRVCDEFDEAVRVSAVTAEGRRRLLQILHSTRALDTALKAFVQHHARQAKKPSLGGYLKALTQHGVVGLRKLPPPRQSQYQQRIVNPRNKYMHEAGAAPTDHHEILALLSEMQSCLAEVTALS
ncbi:MAG: hypothetical protein U0Q18_03970 [Bryobacteraceae bacterium]